MKRDEIKTELKNYSQLCLVGPLLNNEDNLSLECPHIFIDGGILFRNKLTKDVPSWSIGDGDSSSREQMDILLECEKDESDLKAALECIPQEINKIYLKGLLGGRKDHELVNFGEIHHFLLGRNQIECELNENICAYSQGSYVFNVNTTFSVLVFEKTSLEIEGNAKYLLKKKEINPLSSHTLSNIGQGEIKIKANKPFFLFKVINEKV